MTARSRTPSALYRKGCHLRLRKRPDHARLAKLTPRKRAATRGWNDSQAAIAPGTDARFLATGQRLASIEHEGSQAERGADGPGQVRPRIGREFAVFYNYYSFLRIVDQADFTTLNDIPISSA